MKAKPDTQARKLNLSHRRVTQTENKICHTDAIIKYVTQTCRTDGKLSRNKDVSTKLVTQMRKLKLYTDTKTKFVHRRQIN